jgi:tetratricopeptide (TPR) repeat protein
MQRDYADPITGRERHFPWKNKALPHPDVMTKSLTFLILLTTLPLSHGQENAAPANPPAETPPIADCIPLPIKKLGPPAIFPFHKGLVTAISATTETAQLHTLQGLNHLHGGWEFEAMRHFAAAMEEDPRCLMAHWGMVMAMLSPSPETDTHRLATTNRLLELIDDGAGTELERGYAYGLVKYIQEGPAGAAEAFRRVADKFPGEVQAEIFAALFGRTGYDTLGTATPDQEAAENRLLKLAERAPEQALPLHALLVIRAEAPDLRPSLELARRLCQLVPDYAPYFHVLGHYEWRCGEHSKAASAFARAASLYSIWMRENQATPADCPGWVRAECYRVAALASNGDFENALASAEKIATTTTDPTRPSATGTRRLLWDAKTLPARVLLRRASPGDSAKALASLPAPEEGEPFREKSLSYWWVDGLRITLEAQRLLDAGELVQASETISALTLHGQAMSKRQSIASAIGERTEWRDSFQALEMLAAELNGRLALSGPPAGHGSAFNWFRAAADRQKPATMLNPPSILTPMATRLGDYHLARNHGHKALEAYEEALASFPADTETEERLAKAQALAAKQPKPEEKNNED